MPTSVTPAFVGSFLATAGAFGGRKHSSYHHPRDSSSGFSSAKHLPDLQSVFLFCEARGAGWEVPQPWGCLGSVISSAGLGHVEGKIPRLCLDCGERKLWAKGNLPWLGAWGAAGRPPLILTVRPCATSQSTASGWHWCAIKIWMTTCCLSHQHVFKPQSQSAFHTVWVLICFLCSLTGRWWRPSASKKKQWFLLSLPLNSYILTLIYFLLSHSCFCIVFSLNCTLAGVQSFPDTYFNSSLSLSPLDCALNTKP